MSFNWINVKDFFINSFLLMDILKEMVNAGFEYFYHKSKSGGNIYRYRKNVKKFVAIKNIE